MPECPTNRMNCEFGTEMTEKYGPTTICYPNIELWRRQSFSLATCYFSSGELEETFSFRDRREEQRRGLRWSVAEGEPSEHRANLVDATK